MSRSVTVSLRALNTQFDQAYTTSATKAKGLGTAVEASTKKSDKAMKDLGRSSLVVGAGLTAAFVGATRSAMDFDAKMSQVQTLSHATASTMQDLRKAALDYGQAIGFSASQTADAEIELVKAGISVKDILGGGLTGALTLAAAGQIDVAQATEIAASAMTQFKLTGQDVPHIADLLAAGADKALGSVGDLGTALSSSGTVAAQFGWNLEETVGTLSEFAQNAQIGEKGGTLLRQMLLQLAAPSVKAKDLMDKYGLSLYDANGHMVSSSVLAGRLQTSFGGLSESARNFALGQIFGAHAIQGANILMKDGAAVNANWVKSVDDSGFAAQQAAGKMDNLKGDLTKLGAAFKRDIIEGGSQTNGVLRDGAKAATFALNAYADLPAPLQAGATATVGLSGATLVLGGAALAMIPKLKAANATILELTNGSMGLKGALGRAALGTAAITVAITELEAQLSGYRQGARDADQITEKLLARKDINTTKGLQDAANQLEAFSDKELKVAGKGNVLQTSWALVSGGFLRGNKALSDTANTFDQVVAKGDAMNRNLLDMSAATGLSTQKLQALADAAGVDLSGNITDVTTKVVGYYNSAVKGSPATQNLTTALTSMGDTAEDASKKADDLKTALDALIGVHLTADQAADDYQQKLRDLAKTLKENGTSLSNLTDKGAANKAAIRDVIKATLDLRDARAREGATEAQQRKILEDGRNKLIEIGRQYGLTKGQLNAYLQRLADTPKTISTVLEIKGREQALNAIKDVNKALAAIPQHTFASVMVKAVLAPGTASIPSGIDPLAQIPGLTPKKKATGGLLTGPGTGTSDSIPLLASNGEFIMNANATKANLPMLQAMNSRRYATGGQVGYSSRGGTLQQQVTAVIRGGGSADDVQKLIDSYDAYLTKLDQVRQREDLLSTLRQARASKDKQQISDALKALHTFDATAQSDAQKNAADQLLAKLQRSQDLLAQRYEIEDNLYTLGKKSAASEIASLTDRMSHLRKYTNEWMSLYQQRQQVEDAEAARQQQAKADAYAIADNEYELGKRSDALQISSLTKRMNAEKKYSDAWMQLYQQRQAIIDNQASRQRDALSTLNDLLDQVDSIHKQQSDSQTAFAAKQADLLKSQDTALATLNSGMAKAAADFAAKQADLVAQRAKTLAATVALDGQIAKQWGSSVSWLTQNAMDQVTQFQAWSQALAEARGRGVSEGVISALGLDEGPQALNQLRQFSTASQAEIDALNAAVQAKTGATMAQATAEQNSGVGQLGQDLAAAQATYADTVLGLQQDYQSTVADLSTQLQEAQQQFATDQADYARQLAQVGQTQGRSYADALAAGLTSGIPGVLAAAAALAAAATGASTPVKAQTLVTGTVAHPILKSGTSKYDSGGWLQPGYSTVFNGTREPEAVLTGGQWRSLQQQTSTGGDVAVRVFIGERELTDIVRVERTQAAQAGRTANAIAGSR